MNPDKLASLVQEQKKEAERLRQKEGQGAKSAGRYVTLEEKADGLHLTIRSVGDRLIGGLFLVAAFVIFMLSLPWPSLIPFAGGLFLVGMYFLSVFRKTYRIMATPEHFAIFAGASTKPFQYGTLDELKVQLLTHKQLTHAFVHVSQHGNTWTMGFEGVTRSDDLADIEAFGNRLSTAAIARG